jgi:hypothetical protein
MWASCCGERVGVRKRYLKKWAGKLGGVRPHVLEGDDDLFLRTVAALLISTDPIHTVLMCHVQ